MNGFRIWRLFLPGSIVTVVLATASAPAFAQGIVNFANASTVAGWVDPTIDRYVRWGFSVSFALNPNDPVSTNYNGLFGLTSLRAALYYAASTDYNLADFVAASGGTASLRSSTSAVAGSWFGHTDTLDTIPPGTTANLVVFVWDTSAYADGRQACAAEGLSGRSAIFQYTPPTDPLASASDFLMQNLSGFYMSCAPEPPTVTFAFFGATVLLLRHWARRNERIP